MKFAVYLACFVLVSIAHSAISENAVSRERSLDGVWRFASAAQQRADEWTTLPVPSNWNTYTEYADYIGDAWYERDIEIPRDWNGQRIYLKFNAVYDITDVWLAGVHLGQHKGGYTPFEFDVSDVVQPGVQAKLRVKVNNEHEVGAWYQWGGISRSVSLYARDEVRFIHQKIEPVADLDKGTAHVKLLATVENKSDRPQDVVVTATVAELSNVGFRMEGTVPAGKTVTLSDLITLNTHQTRLWHFDDPQLYHLNSTLSYQGKTVDYLNDRFGIRKVEIKPDGMYLNGEKVRLMGYNRVHDHRAYGNVEPRHLVRADIDMMKRSGANFSRLMHAPSAPELLDYCDEVGYMMWAEIPLWQKVYRMPMRTLEDAQKAPSHFPGITMKEMVQRDWNHPSIIGWSPGNELRYKASAYVEAMRPFVKELDPTRLYANIHDQGFKMTSKGGSRGIDVNNVDIVFMNKYENDGKKIKAVIDQRKAVPHMPIFMSEYGESRNESLNFTDDFGPLWKRLGKEPYVIGGAIWTFNDYRSRFKETPKSQNRDWGVVDVWRNPKRLFYDLSKVHQPVRSISLEMNAQTAIVTLQPRGKEEIPSFALRGYSWAYELIDANGYVLEGGLRTLDEVLPGSDPIRESIAWSCQQPASLVISLISATGYTVAETKYHILKGEEMPPPAFPAAADPEVRKVYPLDHGFMVGLTSLPGDTGIELAYGTESGNYSERLKAPVMGAIRAKDLKNGSMYYGKVRRLMKDSTGPWSPEFSVMPDGGLPPQAPVVKGVVRGEDAIAVRIEFPEKVSGYKVTLKTGEVVMIHRSKPGLLILPVESKRLAIVGEYGVSESVSL